MLLSTKDVSELLGIHRTAVTELAKRGYLKGGFVGNSWVFERQELLDFIARNQGLHSIPHEDWCNNQCRVSEGFLEELSAKE